LVTALLLLGAGLAFVRRDGVPEPARAVAAARDAFARLGVTPVGDPSVTFEVDQRLAWALERARPGPTGVGLARGQAGAMRWRVVFPGGGEAQVAVDGFVWSLRRPLPTAIGPDLFPTAARGVIERTAGAILRGADGWRLVRTRAWNEGGRIWQRGVFYAGSGPLPPGWRRELEVELAGSTLVSFRHAVQPLGTDLGVVSARVLELEVLGRPALLGLGVILIGVFVSLAEGAAFRETVAVLLGSAAGLATLVLGLAEGSPALAGAQALVVALVVALSPTWTDVPRGDPRWGVLLGVALALGVQLGRVVILGTGGWTPLTPPSPADPAAVHLMARPWLTALVEEPLLRGALPAMATPVLGWWGASLIAAPIGAMLHPLPSVPLLASIGVALVFQLGLAGVARVSGVTGAILARGACEALLWRAAFPVGFDWDAAALVGVVIGAGMLAWPQRVE
jgi:hypothetical protein